MIYLAVLNASVLHATSPPPPPPVKGTAGEWGRGRAAGRATGTHRRGGRTTRTSRAAPFRV